MGSSERLIVDFHRHLFPPGIVAAVPRGVTPAMAAAWPLITDADRHAERAAAAGTDVAVMCAPLSSVAPAAERGIPAHALPARLNDALAATVQRHDGRLAALATVDAYAGDAGAEEARRAVEDLGLPGIVVDAARDDVLLSDPSARATLAYAAEAGVPIFAHPVTPAELPARYRDTRQGVLLARGTESALSTLSLLSDGVLEELPGLRLVITAIAAAGLLLAPFLDPPGEDGAVSERRGRLFIDTMGFDPAGVRWAVDLLGAEHVLAGSDWPIMWRDGSRERVDRLVAEAGLSGPEADLVAGGNAARLLGLPAAVRGPASTVECRRPGDAPSLSL